MSSDESKFDYRTWKRFLQIAKPFFVSEMRWRAWGLLLLLALFSISVSGLNVLMSFVGRDFITALSLREKDEFYRQIFRYLLAFAAATPVVVFYRYTEERFDLLWRRWLSVELLRRYFSNRAYYAINLANSVDNPDQRIESDIRSFATQSMSFFLITLNSIIALISFVGILWSISAHLVLAVVAYALFGTMMTYWVGRPLIGLNFSQLKKDADFRYKLVNVRDNAESISFFRDEQKEFTRSHQRLKIALKNFLSIINWNRNLNFFTTGYNYVVTILPTILVAPLYLDGQIEFGKVTQAGFAFGQVLGALSIIVLNFNSLSAFTAVINRLGSFTEEIENARRLTESKQRRIKTIEGNALEFREVTILAPRTNKPLIQNLSLAVEPGGLLITGPSGSGKSSIFRAVSGVWANGGGTIIRPALSETMFLPQRPYMVLGSLRSQLLYGTHRRGVTDKQLMEILETVGLTDIIERVGSLDSIQDWPSVLSTGEQQRIAFARLTIARPRYVFLDEATTAIDLASEKRLYSALLEFTSFFVSIGYRSALAPYHAAVLDLRPPAGWNYEKLLVTEAQ